MNGQYNRPLTLTDFLYLIAFYLGINSILSINHWEIYVFFIVITLSLIVDWTSAFTMSSQGNTLLLISDILTSVNYLCIYRALVCLELENPITYARYFIHYGIIFTIYSIWNIILLKSNRATQATSNFLTLYTIAGAFFASGCFCAFVLDINSLIPTDICLVIAWIISFIHLGELLLWLKATFLNKHQK